MQLTITRFLWILTLLISQTIGYAYAIENINVHAKSPRRLLVNHLEGLRPYGTTTHACLDVFDTHIVDNVFDCAMRCFTGVQSKEPNSDPRCSGVNILTDGEKVTCELCGELTYVDEKRNDGFRYFMIDPEEFEKAYYTYIPAVRRPTLEWEEFDFPEDPEVIPKIADRLPENMDDISLHQGYYMFWFMVIPFIPII
eukprot:267210_1